MNSKPESRFGQRSLSQTPLARGALFVAIVWSIAGAFLALESASNQLSNRAMRAGWLPAELVQGTSLMPATLVCRQQDVNAVEAANVDLNDPIALRDARSASLNLGLIFGFATAVSNLGLTDTQMAARRENLERRAAMLHLPVPVAPKSQHILDQQFDFHTNLEADPQCVAARLTRRYGPRYGYLYKFGAVVGYAIPERGVLNAGPVFALEIQLYGRGAGIPQELWLPLTFDSLADLQGADSGDKVTGVVNRLSDYIATSQ